MPKVGVTLTVAASAVVVEGVHLKSQGAVHATLANGRVNLDPLHITGEETDLRAQVLNAQTFPECGFHISGTNIDPECLCDGHYLCPIGHPTSCDQAAAAASGDTTYDSVCEQEVTGGCTDLTAGTSSGGSTTTAACQTCVNNCDNVPSCVDACGC